MLKFKNIVQTRGIAAERENNMIFNSNVMDYLNRFLGGDYGELCEDDRKANELAEKDGSRILAAYKSAKHDVWIIADAEDEEGLRNVTILFPDEY